MAASGAKKTRSKTAGKNETPKGRIKYSEEYAGAICTRLAAGESLRSICSDDAMPCQTTVFKWLKDQDGFAEQYTRAREAQADTIFDEILDIADDAQNDWMERLGDDDKALGWQVNGDHIQRSKLRIEARKWMAGKLRPKVYGDKLELEHSGSIQTMTDEALESRISQLLRASGAAGAAGGEGEAEGST